MVTIFAARDRDGATRYIGEVARGAACNCFCLMCGSALVAKQGDEKEHHFAHAAGNEAPECAVGMANLLRRLLAEELGSGFWRDVEYSVDHPIDGMPALRWSAPRTGPILIMDADGPNEPSAVASIEGGQSADVYVRIGAEPLPAKPAVGEAAVMVVSCPIDGATHIRTESDARAFVRNNALFTWMQLPDLRGLVAAAKVAAADMQRQRAIEAGRRWGAARQAMLGAAREPSNERTSDQAARMPSASRPPYVAPSWAPALSPGATVHYRELDDGSAWVFYPTTSKEWRLAPVPSAFDGWDEFFPPNVATPDPAGWLRVVDDMRLLSIFNAHALVSRITSDLREIELLFSKRNSS